MSIAAVVIGHFSSTVSFHAHLHCLCGRLVVILTKLSCNRACDWMVITAAVIGHFASTVSFVLIV